MFLEHTHTLLRRMNSLQLGMNTFPAKGSEGVSGLLLKAQLKAPADKVCLCVVVSSPGPRMKD